MRALRSRTVQSDSASNVSDTEKPIKKEKRNKKSKKTSKKKQETTDTSLQSQSTQSDTSTSSPHKISRTNITKQALKENISPKPRRSKKKNHRNKRLTSDESLEFKNVASAAIKPKKTNCKKDSSKIVISQESQNGTRLSKTYKSVFIDINKTENELNTTENKTNSSVGSTFELTRNSQDYSPTFKNIVTSTTIKQKKCKQSNKNKKATTSKNSSKEAMEIDGIDNVSSKILLENDIINISDGIASNTDEIKTDITEVLNSTFLITDQECPPVLTTNSSGQWKIEDQKSVINISDELTSNKEIFTSPVDTNKEAKKVLFQNELLSKSARKKWQRFPRNSQGANSVLEQISTPQKKSLSNNKSLNISQKINKTGNTTSTTTKSTNKIKRTEMPDFARIHQRAYDKMESITEYSQRKKDRANLLLSNKKVQVDNDSTKTETIKSSRQLFCNEKTNNTSKIKFNRFGFKVKSPLATANKPQPSVKPLKPSIYERNEILAIANKKNQNTGKVREVKRDVLKGVRTNRRFELLMKMRNNN